MIPIGYIVKHPLKSFAVALERFGALVPDKWYLKIQYRAHIGKRLNFKNPTSFNEKLQWLKLYDRKPEYTIMVDKYLVKKYVSQIIGEEYIIPTIGVWKSPNEIEFNKLPTQFVLKCNHNSGGVIVCSDKSKLNISEAKKTLSASLKQDYYLFGREWPYKNVERRIIAEKYIEDTENGELTDYKLMCFNGEVKCTFTCTERNKNLKVTFFDNNWKRMPFERHYPASKKEIRKPENFDKMKQLAQLLSHNIPFVRIDFYEVKGKVFFGEMTFYPGCGYEEFTPKEWDEKLGSWIKIKI